MKSTNTQEHSMSAPTPRTPAEREAYFLGVEHAKNAASWVIDGNTTHDHIVTVLRRLVDGDPLVEDLLPARPNLSGEWDDDLTPLTLASDILDRDSVELDWDEDIEPLCDAYEAGVADTFEVECERILRAAS
jgi:hypothetical protein